MKKISCFLFVVLFYTESNVIAQDCFPDGITFSRQGQIDSFPFINPGCINIMGPLIIEESVDGAINNLLGLSNIESVGGFLRIFFNDSLKSLNGLNKVRSIGEYLLITDNDALTSLHGLDNVTSIGDFLFVSTNDALTDLSGLNGLTSIGGYVLITANRGLINLHGLDNVTSIGGFLFIDTNNALTSLHGLEKVTSIAGSLSVTFSESIASLDGLQSLNGINGFIRIGNNDILPDLSGLDNIDPGTITDLILENSPALSVCEIASICAYLTVPENPATIVGNAGGCSTRMEVEAACGVVSLTGTTAELPQIIYPNPTAGWIRIPGVERGRVVVTDNLGRTILERTFTYSEVDISDVPTGLYFIRIISVAHQFADRIIKQ